MVAGLALVLSLAIPPAASPEAAPAPPSAGTTAPAQGVVRPADALSPPDPGVEKLQLRIDDLPEQQSAEKLQRLREQRPSVVPPLIVTGLGALFVGIGAIVAYSNKDYAGVYEGALPGGVLIVVGLTVSCVGLLWLLVDAFILADLNSQIGRLEAQQPSRNDAAGRSHGPTLAPWARDGAGGLALSLPLP